MNKAFVAAAWVVASAVQSSAGALDFTDPAFFSTFPSAGSSSEASVTVDGVTFVVQATAAVGSNGFRQDVDGLRFGIPGNGMQIITVTADQDVVFESMTGSDTSLVTGTLPIRFDGVLDDGAAGVASVIDGLSFGPTRGALDFSDFTLSFGDAFAFSADQTARPGYNALFAGAFLTSFAFSLPAKTVAAPVPLPSGWPLMLAGLGALVLMSRRKS